MLDRLTTVKQDLLLMPLPENQCNGLPAQEQLTSGWHLPNLLNESLLGLSGRRRFRPGLGYSLPDDLTSLVQPSPFFRLFNLKQGLCSCLPALCNSVSSTVVFIVELTFPSNRLVTSILS